MGRRFCVFPRFRLIKCFSHQCCNNDDDNDGADDDDDGDNDDIRSPQSRIVLKDRDALQNDSVERTSENDRVSRDNNNNNNNNKGVFQRL